VIRIELTKDELEQLQQLFRKSPKRAVRDRVQAVLMANEGRPRGQTATDLCVEPRTIRRWLKAWVTRRVAGLEPRRAPGAPPRIAQHLAEEVRRWVINGPAAHGLKIANWTHEELARQLRRVHGIKVKRSATGRFCRKHDIRPYHPTYRYLRGDPVKQAAALVVLEAFKQGAAKDELVLLSQDEMRAPMVPTLARALGVKGHRLHVGTRDNKDLLYVFGSVNHVDGRLHTNTLASIAKVLRAERLAGRRAAVSKTRRMTLAFAEHLRAVAAAYPAHRHKRVVLVIDNAPWHRGQPVKDVLAEHPHLEFYRLPAYSPELNLIERVWKWLRRRATHNRLFETMGELKSAVRSAVERLQRVGRRVLRLLGKWRPVPA
jgi:transposase